MWFKDKFNDLEGKSGRRGDIVGRIMGRVTGNNRPSETHSSSSTNTEHGHGNFPSTGTGSISSPQWQSQHLNPFGGSKSTVWGQQQHADSSNAGYPVAPPGYYHNQQPAQQALPPPPQHDWQSAVPDISTFEPPPAVFDVFDHSPTSNATSQEALAATRWCEQNRLWGPVELDQQRKRSLESFDIHLVTPARFLGAYKQLGPGRARVQTAPDTSDQCLFSSVPLYLVREHGGGAPAGAVAKTIYYEVKLLEDSPCNTIAMGFAAMPYPDFRMPGWNRGSLAVHGDDGRKYVNDPWGGRTFTEEFRRGDTYGIGMTFKAAAIWDGQQQQQGPLLVDVVFTKNGVLVGGWSVHEERDSEMELSVEGLEGYHDLVAAVGTFDGVKFEVIFEPEGWLCRDFL